MDEIKSLFELTTGDKLEGVSFNEMKTILKKIEKDFGTKRFHSIVEKAHNEKDDKIDLKNTKDEDEIIVAQEIVKIFKIPEDRLENVLSDIRTQKRFYQQCKNENIELLQDLRHFNNIETCYALPPKYCLRSKETGIQSSSNTDIEVLLEQFKFG